MRTRSLDTCPSCGASGATATGTAEHPLRKCSSCALVYAGEYADPESIYVDGYMTGASDFGPPNTLDPEFQAFLSFTAHERLAVAERIVGRPGSILDVGCGTGDLLAVAAERGWRTVGVEQVQESVAIATARGLDVWCGRLEDVGLPERSFDLVTAFHVLEHLTDPTGFLELIARWVRPGGYVLVEVPNWDSAARRAGLDTWVMLQPLEHVAHYTPHTLRSTLERAGLEPVRIRSVSFLWEGQTLHQALADLGLLRRHRVFHPLARPAPERGVGALVPTRLGWRTLHALERAWGRARRGQVVSAFARPAS